MESSLVMTSDDILEMNEVPESLVIIGGGVVGIELGQAFMTFGSKVTVIEMMDRIDVYKRQGNTEYFFEKFVTSSEICTFDGLVDRDGNIVFSTTFDYAYTLSLIHICCQ